MLLLASCQISLPVVELFMVECKYRWYANRDSIGEGANECLRSCVEGRGHTKSSPDRTLSKHT
jgi:hypothetical protein